MPLQNKQSVLFVSLISPFIIKYCADLFNFVNMDITFFSLRKHLYQLCGIFRETTVCTPCRNPAMIMHVKTCAFYFLAGYFISVHKVETKI